MLAGEWVAVVGFGSAVLSCRVRDEFLGWSREQQYSRLKHVANNQRFCVLPAGRRPNLASAVLSRVLGRLSGDYLVAYGHRVLGVETFTDPARHTGACYAAANFQLVGSGPLNGHHDFASVAIAARRSRSFSRGSRSAKRARIARKSSSFLVVTMLIFSRVDHLMGNDTPGR